MNAASLAYASETENLVPFKYFKSRDADWIFERRQVGSNLVSQKQIRANGSGHPGQGAGVSCLILVPFKDLKFDDLKIGLAPAYENSPSALV